MKYLCDKNTLATGEAEHSSRSKPLPPMYPRKHKDLRPGSLDDLVEVEREIKVWSSKAAELAPNIVALASALCVAPCQMVFKGDLIMFNGPAARDSVVGFRTLDLAAMREIVCNLKVLHAQREQFRRKLTLQEHRAGLEHAVAQ